MKLNSDFEKLLKKSKKSPPLNIAKYSILLYLGLKLAIIFFVFIFLGEWLRKTYDFKYAIPVAFILAIVSIIIVILDLCKKLRKDDN